MIKPGFDAVTALRKAGIVTTRQRVKLLELLSQRKDHPDAESMYLMTRTHIPTLSVDTVYRTLNLFADSGVIQRLAVPTRRARFDGNAHPHDHFLCLECQGIADIAGAAQPVCISDAVKRIGTVQAIQTVYLGTCHHCQKKAAAWDSNAQIPEYEYVV